MVLTHQDVSETSQSLLTSVTRPASASLQRSSVTFDLNDGVSSSAALPLRGKPIPEDSDKPPTNSAASATSSVDNS